MIPTKTIVLERHPEAEQPYELVKEIYITKRFQAGKEIEVETSRLVTKNIRDRNPATKDKTPELKPIQGNNNKSSETKVKDVVDDLLDDGKLNDSNRTGKAKGRK